MKHSFIIDKPFIAILNGCSKMVRFVPACIGLVTVKDYDGHNQESFILYNIFQIRKMKCKLEKFILNKNSFE